MRPSGVWPPRERKPWCRLTLSHTPFIAMPARMYWMQCGCDAERGKRGVRGCVCACVCVCVHPCACR